MVKTTPIIQTIGACDHTFASPLSHPLPKVSTKEMDDSEVIEMAWCDRISFDHIEAITGLPEKEVIKIMRQNLKPSSFRLWRKRVSGRPAKHDKLLRLKGREL